MWHFDTATKSKLFFALLAVVIMGPALGIGYIQTLDMAWGPHLVPVDSGKYTWFLHVVIDGFSSLLPGWVVQKIILLAIIFGAGFGMYRLIETLRPKTTPWILLAAGTFYLFNPFFYTRLLAGQWLVLCGYAVLPWALRSMFRFFASPSWKSAIPVLIWTALIGVTSIHTIAIAAVCFIAIAIYSGTVHWKIKLGGSVALALAWGMINSFWLIPTLTGSADTSREITNFSATEREAFAAHGTVFDSPPLSATLLTGFWADAHNRYILPSDTFWWWIGAMLCMVIIITGAVQVVIKREKTGLLFIALGLVAWVLAVGIAWAPSRFITEALIAIFPLYNGYREPHKWLMLLAISYAYIGAVGTAWIASRVTHRSFYARYGVIYGVFIAIILFAPALAWGGASQLRAADYPPGWRAARSYLDEHATTNTRLLVLPWHMYLPVSFTGRVVANPAGYYFNQRTITGDTFEMNGVPPQARTSTTKTIATTILPNTPARADIAPVLRQLDISYVLLLKESDYLHYSWLNTQSRLTPVINNESLILYKVRGETP